MARTRATAVVIKEGKILIIHRYNNGDEYWVLPGGGVEEGEDVESAVLRELSEETSVQAIVKRNLFEFLDAKGDHHVLFLCEYVSGEPKLHKDSNEATINNPNQSYTPQWVGVGELHKLTIYPSEEKEFLANHMNDIYV